MPPIAASSSSPATQRRRSETITIATPPRSSRQRIPERLGGFAPLSKLGKGGMGQVFRARQESVSRDIALKVLPPHLAREPGRLAQFRREARAMAAISHPQVVTCLDQGCDEGWHWLAMEMVGGGDLKHLRHELGGRVPERLALALLRDVARGLTAVHAAGIVHRDIKPANILLTTQRAPLITDFGAVIKNGKAPEEAHKVVGSPAYMAPEQAAGEAVDARADIYALGATLFHLLTGRTAAPGTTPRETLARLRRGEAAITDPGERTSSPTRELLTSLLARRPERRPADAQQVIGAISDILDDGGESTPTGTTDLPPVTESWDRNATDILF